MKSYPVKCIKSDSIGGNNLANTKGFCNLLRLLWSQTKPIFLPPLLTHTWKLCYLIFAIFAIGHGTFMWWIVICFCLHNGNIHLTLTFLRFPDFLNQLQNYDGPLKILCSVVEPKPKLDQDDFDKYGNNFNFDQIFRDIPIGFPFFFFKVPKFGQQKYFIVSNFVGNRHMLHDDWRVNEYFDKENFAQKNYLYAFEFYISDQLVISISISHSCHLQAVGYLFRHCHVLL